MLIDDVTTARRFCRVPVDNVVRFIKIYDSSNRREIVIPYARFIASVYLPHFIENTFPEMGDTRYIMLVMYLSREQAEARRRRLEV